MLCAVPRAATAPVPSGTAAARPHSTGRRSVACPLADDIAGCVDVGPHPRKVVFRLAGVVPPVGTFIPPPQYFISTRADNVSVRADDDSGRADDDSGRADDDSGRADDGSGRADDDSGRADDGSGRADHDSDGADDGSGRADDDSGRADVVGEVESFVHREEIEAGTGVDDGSRGIGQAGAGSVGRQEGVKNADGLRPRNPACPDAIRGRARTLHRSQGSSSRCRARRQAAVPKESRHPAPSSQGRRLVTQPWGVRLTAVGVLPRT
jgi:hypothetical protein